MSRTRHHRSNGLMTVTPVPCTSAPLRVTNASPWVRAVAAIRASMTGRGLAGSNRPQRSTPCSSIARMRPAKVVRICSSQPSRILAWAGSFIARRSMPRRTSPSTRTLMNRSVYHPHETTLCAVCPMQTAVLAPTAMITATLTMRPSWRTFIWVASSQRSGQSPSSGGSRKVAALPPISASNQKWWRRRKVRAEARGTLPYWLPLLPRKLAARRVAEVAPVTA